MKPILLVFSFLFAISLNAQYDWTKGTIYLKNGKILKGLVKLPMHSSGLTGGGLAMGGGNKVKFKKNENAKKEKFKEEKIKKVIFITEEGTGAEFRLLPVSKRKKELYQVIFEEGETKLYGRLVKTGGGGMWMPGTSAGMGSSPIFMPFSVSDYNELVVFGPDDEKPVNLIPTGLGSFRKKATEYFSDCPELVKKIDEKIYKSEDLKQVVIEYNNCK